MPQVGPPRRSPRRLVPGCRRTPLHSLPHRLLLLLLALPLLLPPASPHAEWCWVQCSRRARCATSFAAGAALPPGALGSALADAVLAPGRLSRAALAGALAALGSGVPREAVVGADLEELRRQLPRWVAAVPAAAAAGTGGGPTGALLARWGALLRAYARAWQDAHLPLALLALPPQGDAHSLMLLARRGGMVTALRPAATPETSLKDGLSADWHQAAPQDAAKASAVFVAAAAVFEAAGGSLAARCAAWERGMWEGRAGGGGCADAAAK